MPSCFLIKDFNPLFLYELASLSAADLRFLFSVILLSSTILNISFFEYSELSVNQKNNVPPHPKGFLPRQKIARRRVWFVTGTCF